MSRPGSPLRRDYKKCAEPQPKQQNRLPWFAAGFGLPVFAIGLFLFGTSSNAPSLEASEEVDISVSAESVTEIDPFLPLANAAPDTDGLINDFAEPIEIAQEDLNDSAEDFHPPLVLMPQYETLELTVRRGDSLDRLFRRNGLDIGDLAIMLKVPEAAPHLKKIMPGDELAIEHDDGKLISLYRELDLTNALRIERSDDGYHVEQIDRPLNVQRANAYGRIETSLFESAVDAGLPDKTVMNLAGIFAWDVDFVLDIRSGDDYYVLYEQLYQDGEYLGDGEIIAAEFNNNGRTIQAIRFVDKNGRSDYFTPDGRSVRKAFLRAPVDFRVSSPFNPNRLHPVLKTVRPHRGTDYAAPHGTPIKASGDGKVIFRGVKSGYGNVVILQHGGNITTLYAHMSRFASRVSNGTRVRQGQTIGYVGKTGLVTGAHLHYEYRLNGVHRNPRTVKLPQADPIPAEYRDEFLASVEPILDELLQLKRARVAALQDD